jgi:hypothetical protein
MAIEHFDIAIDVRSRCKKNMYKMAHGKDKHSMLVNIPTKNNRVPVRN